MPRRLTVLLAVALAATLAAAPTTVQAQEASGDLRAGAGRADITPPTGIPFGGYVRFDRRGQGVHTRLYATAIVLQRGDEKVALVSIDLFAAAGGLVAEAAERAGGGFSERNVLVSASHTHAGPSGYANFDAFNTLAPSARTITQPESYVNFLMTPPPDRQLYTFLVERLATAIRQADRRRRPAAVGWGQVQLPTVTRNRSLEAHLADHGIIREYGQGREEEDPDGRLHLIDPAVDVLRVDALRRRTVRCRRRGRAARCRRTVRVPIGAWTNFANHGTVNPAEYQVYNQDHHGPATRVLERRIRDAAGLPRRTLVATVYGNGNEGDQSAGLEGQGPAVAERVGRAEGEAMFRAWRRAGRRMSRRPALAHRWTRTCFCGQEVEGGGRVATEPVAGMPFLTGSEEGRGPLFEVTGVPFEGRRNPVPSDSQGHKVGINGAASRETVPEAFPSIVVQVRDRLLASVPGEPTVEIGRRIRDAVTREIGPGAGVRRVITQGLANEFPLYFTTPEEYDRQHYEGGSTFYGPYAGHLVRDRLAELAGRLVRGEPAPEPYAFDPRNGLEPDGEPYGTGAASGEITAEPGAAARGGTVAFSWRGGERGLDRPLDRPFVVVERFRAGRWRYIADDLGTQIVWTQDPETRILTATWAVPRNATPGRHRIRIAANRYALTSRVFAVR